jgi:FAD/FMN-containing dehydrogenase
VIYASIGARNARNASAQNTLRHAKIRHTASTALNRLEAVDSGIALPSKNLLRILMADFSIDDIDDPVSFEASDEERDALREEKRSLSRQIDELKQKMDQFEVALARGELAEREQEWREELGEAERKIVLAERRHNIEEQKLRDKFGGDS